MLWATKECGRAELGDARLTQRLVRLTASLSENPESSVPVAAGSWASTKGAYRFFDNARVGPQRVLRSHRLATVDRIKGRPIVLAVQDTTGFNFSTHRMTEGLGPIGPEYAQGFFLHSCLAVDTTKGTPLGLLWQQFWARDGQETGQKESARWVNTMREVEKVVPDQTRVVMVGDRESDLFPLFGAAIADGCDVLVRATHNRKLEGEDPDLARAVASAPKLGEYTIDVPRKGNLSARQTTLALHAKRVTLRTPDVYRGQYNEPVAITVVCAYEIDPPTGSQPIGWVLLTTLPVADAAEAATMVRWYTYRWRIERFHFTLKSGCQVEDLQLETRRRLENAIAVYSIVAWRLLWLTYEARENPDAPCTTVLSDDEWKSLYLALNRKNIVKTHNVPTEPPTLQTAIIQIARLGGFLARKGDGDPGVKALWRGFRRLQDYVLIRQAARFI
ncbi:MAG: IS4 family transposase [Thermaerobacter sp.]|nr:IS4 family transposase [Thermaerobacter sp.]